MLGTVLAASFGSAGLGSSSHWVPLSCCSTLVRCPEAGLTGREPYMSLAISRSLACLSNRECQHLAWKTEAIICSEWGKQEDGLVSSHQGTRLRPLYKLCPKSMTNDCLWNEYMISEALKVKKQNSILRPGMNHAQRERIIERQTWSQLSSVSLAGELARFQGECGRCSLRQTLKVGNAV